MCASFGARQARSSLCLIPIHGLQNSSGARGGALDGLCRNALPLISRRPNLRSRQLQHHIARGGIKILDVFGDVDGSVSRGTDIPKVCLLHQCGEKAAPMRRRITAQ